MITCSIQNPKESNGRDIPGIWVTAKLAMHGFCISENVTNSISQWIMAFDTRTTCLYNTSDNKCILFAIYCVICSLVLADFTHMVQDHSTGAGAIIVWWLSNCKSYDYPSAHDDDIKWKHFRCYCPFVRGFHRSPVNSPQKSQCRGALMFSLICAWTNGSVNNQDVGDLRRHRTHYDITVMSDATLRIMGK